MAFAERVEVLVSVKCRPGFQRPRLGGIITWRDYYLARLLMAFHTISGSLAMAAATRRASSRLSSFTIDRRRGSSS